MKISLFIAGLLACTAPVSVCPEDKGQSFGLIRAGQPVPVYIDKGADTAVQHVATSFLADLERVGAKESFLVEDITAAKGEIVIIGVLGQSPVIDGLIAAGKIRAEDIKGQWEAFRQVVVENPLPGVTRALLIIGSDRRGAVYGAYDLSEKIGVSPWYWWADVPVAKKADVFITKGERSDKPVVKYRGFFINDEEPGFGNWARTKFGGINAKMYVNVFELNLRLKGNYLWPAMWGKAFNDDDRQNMVLADEMGIVVGTSHHEPMTRAQVEWQRNKEGGVTGGKWDYTTNAANLRTFWRGGIERMVSKGNGKTYDTLVTIGMRGDGDEPMTEGTATALLETIVADQRNIIAEVTGKPASDTPQVWALYKEVQDYYDHGMKVPDDVLLLFADDNWGQIRRLPVRDRDRKGGYGVYYHFDYVGGPRNYKWLNTNQIEKTWQQMNLAFESGADDLWIVNVGDIKPMEYPLSFFMDMAWNPPAMTLPAMQAYPEQWATRTFGLAQGKTIARQLSLYAQIAARRKPELIDEKSFAMGSSVQAERMGEFERMVAMLNRMEAETARTKAALSADQHDAYFQLVQHPIVALANHYRLYYAVARNQQMAAANDARANGFADQAEAAFKRDQAITDAYHYVAKGKWQHMMAQTHIGYTGWQQPETNIMPSVKRISGGNPDPVLKTVIEPADGGVMGGRMRSVEWDGVIAIEAPFHARTFIGKGLNWTLIPGLGRTNGAVTALPQGRPSTTVADNVRVEYDIQTLRKADATLHLYMVPTLDTRGAGGIRIGVSIDDGPVQTLSFNLIPDTPEWNAAVSDNAYILKAAFPGLSAGNHTIRVWRLDDNAVVQKLVLDTGGLTPSYLGPVQSPFAK